VSIPFVRFRLQIAAFDGSARSSDEVSLSDSSLLLKMSGPEVSRPRRPFLDFLDIPVQGYVNITINFIAGKIYNPYVLLVMTMHLDWPILQNERKAVIYLGRLFFEMFGS